MKATVRIIALWSYFYGWEGEIVEQNDDFVLIKFPDDPRPIRFDRLTFEVVT